MMNCPYCNSIVYPSDEDIDPHETHEIWCPACESTFMFEVSYIPIFTPFKGSLNGEVHNLQFEKTIMPDTNDNKITLVEPYLRSVVNANLDLINGLMNYYKSIGRSPEEGTFLKHIHHLEAGLMEKWGRLRVFLLDEFEADYAGLALRMIGDGLYEKAQNDGELVEIFRTRAITIPEPYWPAFLQRLAEVINQPHE